MALDRQLEKMLMGSVKPMVTECTIREIKKECEGVAKYIQMSKKMEKRKCKHGGQDILSEECIASIVGDTNQHNYCVAMQDSGVRAKLRRVPGVPILHIHRSVLVLEPPSQATLDTNAERERKKLMPNKDELQLIKRVFQAKDPSGDEAETKKPPIRKRAKGPNPLSMKRPKRPRTDDSNKPGDGGEGEKRKRPRRRKSSAAKPTGSQVAIAE
ncbi:hypothetical protein EV182_004615 [Spiromyces aspiralis]|uniref:Uncharacterized protein n=1 Tax=Spiromyces aspiralis TaxID=68401 RepID=A0ACC1HNU7_9FUNG|nr:hypothetical protein EV182_004615 [Spiromyces aspiralis]